MRTILPFVFLSLWCSSASEVSANQAVFQLKNAFTSAGSDKSDAIEYLDAAKQHILEGKKNLEKWYHSGVQYIKQDGLLYELVLHPSFSEYQLRVTEPNLCDPSVQQYSGYLDIAEDKHLFFWFFEARNSPETAPLLLWLNGGPGGSSLTGLMFELGPCTIVNEGANTTINPHSWTDQANVIFLDQPVNVGFSYADDGTTVSTSLIAGQDVYAFLQLFFAKYPKYASLPFHIAAESYGGTYAPNFASVIHQKNKALSLAPIAGVRHIPLSSVILANGRTDPYIQLASIPDYACGGPFPVFDGPDDPRCAALRGKVPTCLRLIKSCYTYGSRFSCVPAELYCRSELYGPLMETGLNPYDVRLKCDRETDGELCYRELEWIDPWMNDPQHKAALGVDPSRQFSAVNSQVNEAFTWSGDGMHRAAALLPELIESGVRLLIYAGNADMMCNYIGNELWVNELETSFRAEFSKSKPIPWVTDSGKLAGEFRSAGGAGFTAGNVTFVNVYDAGHMVPHDQPEAALDLITKWLADDPLS